MKSIMLVFAVLMVSGIRAQDSTIIFVKAGQSISEVATPSRIYRFPNFTPGKIVFKDETISEGKLNYNFFNEEIEFLTLQGDTLAIAKQQMLNIDFVAVNNQIFYFNTFFKQGYLEEVLNAPIGKLLKRERYSLLKREKIGGYNQPSSTTVIESYGNFTNDQGIMETNLLVKENLTFIKKTDYFLSDKYNRIVPANKRNLLKMFSKNRIEIDTYLKSTELDFEKEEDLKRLLSALQAFKIK